MKYKNLIKSKFKLEKLTHKPISDLNYYEIVNKVRFHNRGETFKHFLVKAMISKILFNRGRVFVTEAEFKCGRVVDVLDVTEKIGYEVETSGKNSKKDPINIVTIDLRKVPDEIKGLEKYLKKEVM